MDVFRNRVSGTGRPSHSDQKGGQEQSDNRVWCRRLFGFQGHKGSAKPNCGDFSDYFNEEVQDVAKDTGDFFGNIAKGFADNWSTWLFVILIVVVVGYFFFKAVS
jgi:hypothetical protein